MTTIKFFWQQNLAVYLRPYKLFELLQLSIRILLPLFIIMFVCSIYWIFWISPNDYQQSFYVLYIYLHVPAAMLSLAIYAVAGVLSLCYLATNLKLTIPCIRACQQIGIIYTGIVLITGALWGAPTWGTYWVWDARLTSEFILFWIYLGQIILYNAIMSPKKDKILAVLCVLGLLDLPIIHYSVQWWFTLHQGSAITSLNTSGIHSSILNPLLFSIALHFILAAILIMQRVSYYLSQEITGVRK